MQQQGQFDNDSYEASILGFRPGEWPTAVALEQTTFHRGQPVWYGQGEDRELGGYEYRSDAGRVVTIWND